MLRNTEQRYGSLSIGLHWLTLLLMIAVYALMEFRDIFPKGFHIGCFAKIKKKRTPCIYIYFSYFCKNGLNDE